jgi:hypothetical protein
MPVCRILFSQIIHWLYNLKHTICAQSGIRLLSENDSGMKN